jgi:hypothetical protein
VGTTPFAFLLRPLGHNATATGSRARCHLSAILSSSRNGHRLSPLQTPPVAPGSPPETAAHRHQWHRPSSLHSTASPPSSSPYKRVRSTPGHHHTHPRPPLLTPESATPTSLSTDRRRPSLSAALPFHHLPSSDEPTNVLTAASSTSSAPSPVTLSPGVAGG